MGAAAHRQLRPSLVDQPLFVAGLLLFAAGVVASYLDRALLPFGDGSRAPGGDDAGPVAATLRAQRGFLRLGAASTLLALAVLAVAYARLSVAGDVTAAYEQLLWGCGHVLQLATVAFEIVAWALLAAAGTGRPVAAGRPRASRWGCSPSRRCRCSRSSPRTQPAGATTRATPS